MAAMLSSQRTRRSPGHSPKYAENHSTASREPDGLVCTASGTIGKMQLDGPTQAMQLSCSPRRRALMPNKAVVLARTDVGTPCVLESAIAFLSQTAVSSWSPSYKPTNANCE